jgi:hypothetical protein
MAARFKSKGSSDTLAPSRASPASSRPEVASFLAELLAEAEAAQDRLEFAASLGQTGKAETAGAARASPSRRTRRPRSTE